MKNKSTIIWTVSILLCLEILVRFYGISIGKLVINSDFGCYEDMDMKLSKSTNSPNVVFLGSSRIRDAISPRIVAE